jgi:hypothetical protein
MSIIIGCDSFLALRNVRSGGLGRWLAGEPVQVWVDPRHFPGAQPVKPEGTELGCLEEFDIRKDPVLERFLFSVGYAHKCYYDPATIWADFVYSSHRNNRSNPLRRAASTGRAAGRLAGYWLAGRTGMARRWRAEFANALRKHPIAERYRQRLRQENAQVVASFSPEGFRELALIEAANSAGIPTVVMIRSRDNLASKIPFLPYADAYLVWSGVLRDYLLAMYPDIAADRVHVTGAPQFDRHLNTSYRLDRDHFFSLLGLDPARPLIAYSMGVPGVITHEIEIVQHLADAAHAGRFARGAQLLVRGHPRMFGSDQQLLRREYPEARCYPAPTQAPFGGPEHEANVVRRILEDEPIHLSLLAYQDVQVNVCGTMTIDSAIYDKPTVNIYYDLVEGLPSGVSVRRFYKRSDTRQMMSYGASRLAHDPAECISLVNRYLENPSLDAAGRKRAREMDCGPLDGFAGRRAAGLLASLNESRAVRVH